MYEDLTFSNLNDFLQSANPLIEQTIMVDIAAPFIPKIGINIKLDNKPINVAIPHHLNDTFSLPVILIIDPTDPKKEFINGLNKIISKVNFGIKKSIPKNMVTNFL